MVGHILATAGAFASVFAITRAANPLDGVSPATWAAFNTSVGGRLAIGKPLEYPCSANQTTASEECSKIQTGYTNPQFRSGYIGGFVHSQFETCQKTGDQCLLDSSNPTDLSPIRPPRTCGMGSVAPYYVDVRSASDVSAALNFSRTTKVPIVVKNTGHDYKGRSSAPNTLALWTHNLKDITYNTNFVPEKCSGGNVAVTIGAGVQWQEVYDFAEAHNITVIGGSDGSVGASGGWIQGGGHSFLSNVYGLGVDRTLQFKVVTPDGQLRVVNACQNTDLFFALRGGGGGTFGVVLETTFLASPQIKVQLVFLTFNPNTTLAKEMFTIMADNALQWSKAGWGGGARASLSFHINPVLNKDDAAASLAPMIAFGKRLVSEGVPGAQLVVTEFPSWLSFYKFFVANAKPAAGVSLAIAGRLVQKENFATASARTAIVDALLAVEKATPGRLLLLMDGPASFPGDGTTSVTPAWRNSIYTVTTYATWNWDATAADKLAAYGASNAAIDNLRRITPDASYINEASVYEPNHEVAFWGSNYAKLLTLKQKYDPDHLFDCWHCVGWNKSSSLFSCYL